MALKPGDEMVIDGTGMRYTQRAESVVTPDEVERLRAQVAELVAESEAWEKASVVRMATRMQKLEAMLRDLQWQWEGHRRCCPVCRRWVADGHTPDCELAALLGESED